MSVYCFLEGHKPAMPIRVVVNKTGTWKKAVSVFLQETLEDVNLDQSLSLKNLNELIEELKDRNEREYTIFWRTSKIFTTQFGS